MRDGPPSPSELPPLRKARWMAVVRPNEPVALPKLPRAAVRLSSAAVAELGGEALATLSLAVPKVENATPFLLARLRPSSGGEDNPVRVRALIGCHENAVLHATGSAVAVSGRLEGDLPLHIRRASAPEQDSQAAEQGGGSSSSTAAVEGGGRKANAKTKTTSLRKASSVEEFLDWIEERLRKDGPTALREMGNWYRWPGKSKKNTLKTLINDNRHRFQLDVHGRASINYSKRRRFQGVVDRPRFKPH